MVENKILLQSQPTYSSSINLGELFLYRLVFNRLKEMNKLEKWLWTNCELKDNGQISNSLYFYYGNLEIQTILQSRVLESYK